LNNAHSRFWQILLQKSFWGVERKFLELLMHFARGDVRDHIASSKICGSCISPDIYSTRWPIGCIAEPYRDLMEWQVVVELAGGIAEAIHRGERRKQAVLAFAESNCNTDVDLKRAAAVLADLRRLTGRRYDEQRFAGRALALLLTHWAAVDALAFELIEKRRVEGERVEAIIAGAAPENNHRNCETVRRRLLVVEYYGGVLSTYQP
jgi:hypothetical protein